MSVWMVTDLSQPPEANGPQFGPFEIAEEARTFAEMRESYWAHLWNDPCNPSGREQ